MKKILQIRLRDIPVKGNFPGAHGNNLCPSEECSISGPETQSHLMLCPVLTTKTSQITQTDLLYSQIFEEDVFKQFCVMKIIFERLEVRSRLMKERCRNVGPEDPGGLVSDAQPHQAK